MDELLCDMRDAVRQIRARPAFTAAVLAILAVGIGANTATFSLVNGLMLRPLPYADALVAVGRGTTAGGAAGVPRPLFPTVTKDELRQLQDSARSFEQLAAYENGSFVWDGPYGLVQLLSTAVTPSFFPLLRTTPWLGRIFTEADAAEGAERVVLLSHGAWTRHFGSDPDVIGAAVELNLEPYTVIGVLPDAFAYPSREVELWVPLHVPPYAASGDDGVRAIGVPLIAIARLRPEVSPEQAATEARTLLARPAADQPREVVSEVSVRPVREELARPFRASLQMLGAATGMVLLVTCANVAGLLLVRGVVRQPELAIRGALGAGRGRIARQLLAESVMLSVAGGALGVAVAAGIVRAAAGLVPDYVPGLAGAGLDGTVLVFAAALAVGTGVVFGTAPALAGSRVDLVRTLNEGSAAAAGGFGRLRVNRTQAALAVAQVAVALSLLIGAGLLLRSFMAFVTFDHGYDPAGIQIFMAWNTDPRSQGGPVLDDPDRFAEKYAAARRYAVTLLTAVERIEHLPGIDAVALAGVFPFLESGQMEPIGVAGRPPPVDPRQQLRGNIRTVSPGYADVLQLRVRAGRFFTDRDAAGSQRIVVVSESFAQRAFGDAPAVGQRLVRPAVAGDGAEEWEVIGVVDDISSPMISAQYRGASAENIYVPVLQPGMTQHSAFSTNMILVRSDRTPLTVLAFLREEYAQIRPTGTIEQFLAFQVAQPRFFAMCAGIFGAVALLLAAFGLYGVLSHTVAQRRREIGIRMALGAGRRNVVGLIVRQGGALVAGGVILGLLAAFATTRVVEHLLFDITPADPLTFGAVTAMLVAFALLACWLPARRAARINPMDAIREA